VKPFVKSKKNDFVDAENGGGSIPSLATITNSRLSERCGVHSSSRPQKEISISLEI